eukprot:Hpha_TRINITY_DN34997_c0_g1::TRINITY_DN34997_c0_g1_i1::g.184192::m.184192
MAFLLYQDSQLEVWRVELSRGYTFSAPEDQWEYWWCGLVRGELEYLPASESRPKSVAEYGDFKETLQLPLFRPDEGKVNGLRGAGPAAAVAVVVAWRKGAPGWKEHAAKEREKRGKQQLLGRENKAPESLPGMTAIANGLLYEDAVIRVWDQWLPPKFIDPGRHLHMSPYWLFTVGFPGCSLESPGSRPSGEKSMRRFALEKPVATLVAPGRTESASNVGDSPYRAILVEAKQTSRL